MRGLRSRAALAQRVQISLMDGIYGCEPENQSRTVQLSHPRARHLIFHRPKAHDQRPCARYFKGAPQTQYAFPGLHFTDSGIACGKDCPLHTAQIQRGNFFSSEDSVFFVRSPTPAPAARQHALCYRKRTDCLPTKHQGRTVVAARCDREQESLDSEKGRGPCNGYSHRWAISWGQDFKMGSVFRKFGYRVWKIAIRVNCYGTGIGSCRRARGS